MMPGPGIFLTIIIIFSGTCLAQGTRDNDNIIADWGSIYYLTGPEEGGIYHTRIYATDSILHIYADNGDLRHLYHYISLDNGDDWTFLANEVNPDFWINNGPVMAYFGHEKFYTTYEGCYFNHLWWEAFTYFRGSTDYGQTWTWSAELRLPIQDASRASNITGNGDSVFVIACQSPNYQDSLRLWRSYDAGLHWQQFTLPCSGGYHTSGLEYDKSKGVLHVAYYGYDGEDLDIYYIRSTDQGATWQDSTLIGFPEDGPSNCPAMGSDGLGNVAITWQDYHEHPLGPPSIYCRISHDEGVSWQPAIWIGQTSDAWSDVIIQGGYIGVLWARSENQIRQLAYRISHDGGNTWEDPQIVAIGRFLYGSLLRINETVHIAFRQRYQYDPNTWSSRAGYIRYDPSTENRGDINEPAAVGVSIACYPNPFNAATTIKYYLSAKSEISLSIFNPLGQRVETLFEGVQNPGEHALTWDASQLPSGIYFARLETAGRTENIKMVLLK